MGTDTQHFLHNLATSVTLLGGETGVDSYYSMSGTFSLNREYVEELPPSGIANRSGKMVIFDHIGNMHVFHRNDAMRLAIVFGNLEMEVTPLPLDFQVGLRCALTRFTTSLASPVASGYRALLASKCVLRDAIGARIGNGLTLTIGQERLQAHIDPYWLMSTATRWMLLLIVWHLADNKDIPVTIGTKDKMSRFRGSFQGRCNLILREFPNTFGT